MNTLNGYDGRTDGGESSPRQPLRLAALLHEVDFGLVVRAGHEGLNAPIEGVHLSELQDPTPWMLPRSLLLSTGLGLLGDSGFGPRLVERLSAQRMTGLVVALGHSVHVLPADLQAAADRLRFPLLTSPLHVPFRRITAFVYNALSSEDLNRLRRTVSIQNHLLKLINSDRGLEHLVENLEDLLCYPVVLVNGGGSLVCHSRNADGLSDGGARALFEAFKSVAAVGDGSTVLDAEHNRVVFRDVLLGGHRAYVLFVLLPEGASLPELGESVLNFVQGLVGTHALKERDRVALWREVRSSLLDDLVVSAGAERELARRMMHCGFDPHARWRLAICDIRGFADSARTHDRMSEERLHRVKRDFLGVVDDFFASRRLSALTDGKGDSVLALFEIGDESVETVDDLLGELASAARHLYPKLVVDIGASSAGVGPLAVKRAFFQAQEALASATAAGGGRLAVYDTLGPLHQLVGTHPPERLESIVSQTLGSLIAHDARHHSAMVDTIRCYVECNLNIAATANSLRLHRNTVRHRLDKIEALVEKDLGEVHGVLDLVLGLYSLDQLTMYQAAGSPPNLPGFDGHSNL